MIKLTETASQGTYLLKAEYSPLRCRLEATFYPETQQLGTWIGGGDDWVEDFSPCPTLSEARKLLTNQMLQLMKLAEGAL